MWSWLHIAWYRKNRGLVFKGMTAGYSQMLSAFHFHFVKQCWSFPGTIETGLYLPRVAWNLALTMDCAMPPGCSPNTQYIQNVAILDSGCHIQKSVASNNTRDMFRTFSLLEHFCRTKLNLSRYCYKTTCLETKPPQIKSTSAVKQKIIGWVLSCKALLCYSGFVPPAAQSNSFFCELNPRYG